MLTNQSAAIFFFDHAKVTLHFTFLANVSHPAIAIRRPMADVPFYFFNANFLAY
jgi:hypothetical protein